MRYLANALPALQLLDVIDAILGVGGPWPALDPLDPPFGDIEGERAAHMRWELEVMLAEGRSAYRVNDTGDGLTIRVAQAAFQSVVASAGQAAKSGSAADLLRTAWDALYALHPDAPKAYRHAVSAVEAAAAATIEPNNSKATLGTMLGQLRSHRQQYLLAIPGPSGTGGITPLIEMMTCCGRARRHVTAVRPPSGWRPVRKRRWLCTWRSCLCTGSLPGRSSGSLEIRSARRSQDTPFTDIRRSCWRGCLRLNRLSRSLVESNPATACSSARQPGRLVVSNVVSFAWVRGRPPRPIRHGPPRSRTIPDLGERR